MGIEYRLLTSDVVKDIYLHSVAYPATQLIDISTRIVTWIPDSYSSLYYIGYIDNNGDLRLG